MTKARDFLDFGEGGQNLSATPLLRPPFVPPCLTPGKRRFRYPSDLGTLSVLLTTRGRRRYTVACHATLCP